MDKLSIVLSTVYKPLYKKDTNGNIRIWYMEQNDSKYRTFSGVEDGQLVVSDWKQAKPKNVGKINERSAVVQATEEILSKYKKQEKTGYITQEARDAGAFETAFTKIKPMLAQNYKDRKKDVKFDGTWGIQTKLNGARCIITKDGMFTRKNERFISCPHIFESLKPFFDAYPNAVLDGELFNESYKQKLNEMMSLIRKTKKVTEDDLKISKDIVMFYLYDFYDTDDDNCLYQSITYKVRRDWINSVIRKYENHYVVLVTTTVLKSEDTLDKFYKTMIENGHEGIILRKLNGPYEQKRSKYLLKYKPMDDAECTILDIQEGEGNWAGKAKTISVQWEDVFFDITFKGSMEDAEEMLEQAEDWIGKEVTFEYYGLTGLGTPNFGQLNYRNCLKE